MFFTHTLTNAARTRIECSSCHCAPIFPHTHSMCVQGVCGGKRGCEDCIDKITTSSNPDGVLICWNCQNIHNSDYELFEGRWY